MINLVGECAVWESDWISFPSESETRGPLEDESRCQEERRDEMV